MFKVEQYLKVSYIGGIFNQGRSVDYYQIVEHLFRTPIWYCQVVHPKEDQDKDDIRFTRQFLADDTESLSQICSATDWQDITIHIIAFPGPPGDSEIVMERCLKLHEFRLDEAGPPCYKVETPNQIFYIGVSPDDDLSEVDMKLVWHEGLRGWA